jgi:hypothetical protein
MNNKPGIRGLMAATIPALFFFASCEMPESIRIKASPTIQIPIPLGEGVDNSFIRPYVNTDTITENLSGADKKVLVADYKSDDVQTYLITYPLFDMDLDFNEYINGAGINDTSRVPPVEISQEYSALMEETWRFAESFGYLNSDGSLPFNRWVRLSTMEIDLGDMKSLISDICLKEEGVTFTLEAGSEMAARQLQKAIRIRVPQLKIGSSDYGVYLGEDAWVSGAVEGKNVVFRKKPGTNIDPSDPVLLLSSADYYEKEASEKIAIEIRLANTIDAGTYKSELGFNWSSAKVYPQYAESGAFQGEIDGFNLRSYLDELGINGVTVEFDSIPAYLYVKTPDNFATKPEISISGMTANDAVDWPDAGKISDPGSYNWLLSDSGRENITRYDFAQVLNQPAAKIKYQIKMSAAVTIYSGTSAKKKITANLAVLLPMIFKFTPQPQFGAKTINIAGGEQAGTYLPINFKEMDDFLGSSNSGNDSVMDQIDEQLGEGGVNGLELRLTDIKNKVTSPIYLAIATKTSAAGIPPDEWNIIPIKDPGPNEERKSYTIPIENPGSLKSLPEIKFLLKRNDPTSGYTLSIQPQNAADETAFGVKISVVADISLDKTLEIQ